MQIGNPVAVDGGPQVLRLPSPAGAPAQIALIESGGRSSASSPLAALSEPPLMSSSLAGSFPGFHSSASCVGCLPAAVSATSPAHPAPGRAHGGGDASDAPATGPLGGADASGAAPGSAGAAMFALCCCLFLLAVARSVQAIRAPADPHRPMVVLGLAGRPG